MRIVVAFILIICIGGVIAAAYSIGHVNFTSAQIDQVKTTCAECHKIPVVRSAEQVHDAHEDLDCVACHPRGTRLMPDFKTCQPCHTTPQYTNTVDLHNVHYGTDCVTCHGAVENLQASNNPFEVLRMAGIGIAAFGVLGLIGNYVITRLRLRK